jgi:hypothetical protein
MCIYIAVKVGAGMPKICKPYSCWSIPNYGSPKPSQIRIQDGSRQPTKLSTDSDDIRPFLGGVVTIPVNVVEGTRVQYWRPALVMVTTNIELAHCRSGQLCRLSSTTLLVQAFIIHRFDQMTGHTVGTEWQILPYIAGDLER